MNLTNVSKTILLTSILIGIVFTAGSIKDVQAGSNEIVPIVFSPWDWVITIDPIDPATGAPMGAPVDIPVWGEAVVLFDDSNIPGGLGTQDNPLPLPNAGEEFSIPIEIVSMELRSMGPVLFPGFDGKLGEVIVRLAQGTTGEGVINVANRGGTLFGDSFFDVFFEVEVLPTNDCAACDVEPMLLTTDTPLTLGMPFGEDEGIPAIDVFWLPSWIWLENTPGSDLPATLLFDVENPWDVVVDVHGHITPPTGNEGCTPGFWKNHLDEWSIVPTFPLRNVFDVSPTKDNPTLEDALRFKGGKTATGAEKILLRAGVAAFLNAASMDVAAPQTEDNVVSKVNAAIASGERQTMIEVAEELDENNNLVCPFDVEEVLECGENEEEDAAGECV
jgi:hypothetical protein